MPQVELSFEEIAWPEWANTKEENATRDYKTNYLTGKIRKYNNIDNTDSDHMVDQDKNYLKYGNKMGKSDNKRDDSRGDHLMGKLIKSTRNARKSDLLTGESNKNDRKSDHIIRRFGDLKKNDRKSDHFIGRFVDLKKNDRKSEHLNGKFKESKNIDNADLIVKSRKYTKKAKKELDNDLNKNLLKSLVKKKR